MSETNNLNEYYKRVFPSKLICDWLCYGDRKKFFNREICLTLQSEVFVKHNSFDSLTKFNRALAQKSRECPLKIDIGAIYSKPPKHRKRYIEHKEPYRAVEKEITIDVDLDDYNDLRSCCPPKQLCPKCWPFIVVAVRVLEHILVKELGLKNRLWVFSGRRGVHCWIAEEEARTDRWMRGIVAKYLVISTNRFNTEFSKLNLFFYSYESPPENLITKILPIIDKYIMQLVIGQDLLGSDSRILRFVTAILKGTDEEGVKMIDTLCEAIKAAPTPTTECRWKTFEATVKKINEEKPLKCTKSLIEKAKFFIAYPRIDYPVTKHIHHLLKAPFSVHPDTKKVSEPFNADQVDQFDPFSLPTFESYLSINLNKWPAMNVFRNFLDDLFDVE